MGCGGSTTQVRKRSESLGTLFKRMPKISLRSGNNVKVLDAKPRVILVFGGPGSKKGKILDKISNVFKFQLLNVENIILEELAAFLEKPDPNNLTPAIQQLLKNEPERLRLDWVLRMIGKKLDSLDKEQFYVIDFMPNLKFMLNISSFTKDCFTEFKVFEDKYPVSFVINLAMPKEKALKKVEVESAKHPAVSKDQSKGQSDEVDSSRTQKRVTLYQNSVKHVLEYFTKTDKMVTVDVSCGNMDAVWVKMCDFFSDLGFEAKNSLETVIIFGFDKEEVSEIETIFSLTMISLREVAYDPNAPVEHLLDIVCRNVDESDPTRRVFAVDTTGTSFTKEWEGKHSEEKRKILFHDGRECQLNDYCLLRLATKTDPINMQAVSSLENEVCVFNKDIPIDFCKRVAAYLRTCREKNRIH